jgi:hypothetical protein
MAEVILPQLGETVTEGTITQWFKQVGDSVAAEDHVGAVGPLAGLLAVPAGGDHPWSAAMGGNQPPLALFCSRESF